MALSEQLASFFANVKFVFDGKGLKDVDSSFKSLGERLTGFKNVAGAVAVAMQQVMSLKFANITAEEEKFATLNGVLRQNVDALKLMATQANVSEGTVTGALSQISKQKQDLMTMRSIPMWVRFGIDPRQSPDKVLKDILNKVKKFSGDTQKQMALLSRLGLSREFVLMFKEGNLEIDEATKKLLEFKQMNAQSSKELVANVGKLKILTSGFLQGLNGIITPIMNLCVKGVTWIAKELFTTIEPLLTLIGKSMEKITTIFKKIFSFCSPVILFILKVVAITGTIILGAKAVLGVLALIKIAVITIVGIITSPIGIIVAITAAVLALWKAISPETFEGFFNFCKLVLEDILDYLNGVPNTIFGETVERWKKQWNNFCEGFKKAWNNVWQSFVGKIEAMKEKFRTIKNFFKFGNKNDEKIKEERKGDKEKGIRRGIFGQPLSNEDIERMGLKKNILPREQQNLAAAGNIRKENNIKNEIKNEINVTTNSDKPLDIANMVKSKVEGIQYQTKIQEDNNTASYSSNVLVGRY